MYDHPKNRKKTAIFITKKKLIYLRNSICFYHSCYWNGLLQWFWTFSIFLQRILTSFRDSSMW